MAYRLHPVTAASITQAPDPCVDCVFWQSRGDRSAAKPRWAQRVEDDYGAWGTLYFGDADSLLGFEDPDRPWSLERIIEACGGEPVDYPAKIKCCGFPIIQAREETALGELIQPIEQAKEAGADAMVTPCPLCHLSLDAWQTKLRKQTGKDFQMPILHLSQLIGVAAGLTDSELKFKRHVVSVDPVLEKLSV